MEWDTAEEFVRELGDALARESAIVRETELDHTGGFQEADVEFEFAASRKYENLFVDKLGRVVTPAIDLWEQLTWVTIQGKRREVLKKEPRYEGDLVVAFVHYLDSLEGQNGNK